MIIFPIHNVLVCDIRFNIMYRLLHKTSPFKVNGNNFSRVEFQQPFTLTCTLCNRENALLNRNTLPNKLYSRNLTTSKLNILQVEGKKKKKFKKPKKYTELMEVKEDSSNVTKAVVTNLNSKNITKLTEQPEINLEYFSNLIKKSNIDSFLSHKKTSNNLEPEKHKIETQLDDCTKLLNETELYKTNYQLLEKDIENELKCNLIYRDKENVEMIPNVDIEQEKVTKFNVKPELAKKDDATVSKKPTNNLMIEKEKKFLIDNFNLNMSSYIELCVYCDYLNVGFATLNKYIMNPNKNVCVIRSAFPFNSLMHGYAKKKNFDKIQELFRMMKISGISANPQTFAAGFEAIGRLSDTKDTAKYLQTWYDEFTAKKFKFQDLFDRCSYLEDQREFVLKSIHQLDPGFVPNFNPPTLHYNCSLLNELNKKSDKSYQTPCKGLVSEEEMKNFIQEQIKIESSPVKIKSVIQPPELTEEIIISRKKWNDLQDMWRMSIREALVRDLQTLKMQQNSTKLCHNINIYPYLKALTLEQHVEIVLQEILSLVQGSEMFSLTAKYLRIQLGHRVRLQYQIKYKQQHGIMNKIEKVYQDYCKWYLNPEINPKSTNTRQQWQHLLHINASNGPSLDEKEFLWPANIVEQIGTLLYNIIIKDVKVDVNCLNKKSQPLFLPSFYSLFRYQGRKLIEEIKPHPQLIRLFKDICNEDLVFQVNLLPMVSPPIPWISTRNGGYVIAKADFVRMHYGMSKVVDNVASQKIYPALDSLNQLGSIPWRINEKILDLVLEVFRKGGSNELNIPHSPSTYLPRALAECGSAGLTYRQRIIIQKKKAEMYGLWCEALYRLSLANHYRNRIIWLPHNLDFRGRVYPVPPHLTHLGSDMARSLLMFAKGEKLGPKGLDWLKIHCINLTSLKKKSSLKERLEYANEILPDILDSAENPLTGKMWWAESEEQWQTLACCMEIKNAIDSGDPENYVSRFPVHQDGSCNGLQHYAALGRDKIGAESVNLTPSEAPQDVYSCVVNLVEAQRIKDAENGMEIARDLEGHIQRKVIKQTIMTTVYGVTKYGARLQIMKQLKDLEGIETWSQHKMWNAAGYLTMKTFECLQEMFTSSREIQNWFTTCAGFITQTCDSKVEWETPLGFPVVQPYVKTKKTNLLSDGNAALNKLSLDVVLKPVVGKQKNAFPPNFIHSLDSSHMMLTSLFCERDGITFVSVHDCFWTYPRNVDAMNKICRQQFVNLHSEPILENLSKFFARKFSHGYSIFNETEEELPHDVLTKVPAKGDLDLKSVLQSTYFFS